MKTIYYYQTLIGLEDVIKKSSSVNVIYISSIHFGKNPDNSPYIHLNNKSPNDKIHDKLWIEAKECHKKGIDISVMLGGAGGAYTDLFDNFATNYTLLLSMLRERPYITGIDLDIEEEVSLKNVKFLIRTLRLDFPNMRITMAPIASSLSSDGPGMGGFSYKDLYNSNEGKEISWFNVQAYGDYSPEGMDDIVKNGYPASKIVYGMLSIQFDKDTFKNALQTIQHIKEKYKYFCGVFVWEYFDCPPGPKPIDWAVEISKMKILDESNCVMC